MILSSLYPPPDMDKSAELFGAACGHGAFAAAMGWPVCKAVEYFPLLRAKGKRSVNGIEMKDAIFASGRPLLSSGKTWPETGVILLQWVIPKMPRRFAFHYRHWIAVNGAFVWDANVTEWITRAIWEDVMVSRLLPKRATGWEIAVEYEIGT